MKGLASTNKTFTAVRISGRSARKSYGIDAHRPFQELIHDISRRYVTRLDVSLAIFLSPKLTYDFSFWSDADGFYRINIMDWFIRKVYIAYTLVSLYPWNDMQ